MVDYKPLGVDYEPLGVDYESAAPSEKFSSQATILPILM
jgi:hypothetical protein